MNKKQGKQVYYQRILIKYLYSISMIIRQIQIVSSRAHLWQAIS